MNIPDHLSDKAAEFPECSYGATKVTLFLADNRKIKNVILAWGSEIVKIDGKPFEEDQELGFTAEDIVDVRYDN